MTTIIAHTLIALAMLVGYVVLTALGHDANELLAILGGYAGGVAVNNTATGSGGKPL